MIIRGVGSNALDGNQKNNDREGDSSRQTHVLTYLLAHETSHPLTARKHSREQPLGCRLLAGLKEGLQCVIEHVLI
jgi:hypothetical protein